MLLLMATQHTHAALTDTLDALDGSQLAKDYPELAAHLKARLHEAQRYTSTAIQMVADTMDPHPFEPDPKAKETLQKPHHESSRRMVE